MSKKAYIIFNIVTGSLKGGALAAIVLWLLPLWGINIPIWGLALIVVAFLIYEIVTFRVGRRALERNPAVSPKAIVGCCGKATTQLAPGGYVQVNGELWRALSSDTKINEGDEIVVVEMNRLILRVAPLSGTMMGTSVKPDAKYDKLPQLRKTLKNTNKVREDGWITRD